MQAKPHLYKSKHMPGYWACCEAVRGVSAFRLLSPSKSSIIGYGRTPTLAYRDWARSQNLFKEATCT